MTSVVPSLLNYARKNAVNVFTANQQFDIISGNANNRMFRFENPDSAVDGYYSLFVDSQDNTLTTIQNQICSLGYNIARAGKDPGNGNHGLRIAMESNYDDIYGWGSQIWESHLISAYTPAGVEYRPITWAGRIDGTRVEGEFKADAIRFINNRSGEQSIIINDLGSPNNYKVAFNKCLIDVGPNNSGVLRQKAADGTTDIELIRTNASNQVVVGINSTTLVPILQSTFNTLLCTNGNSGSLFVGGALTGVTRVRVNQDAGYEHYLSAESAPRIKLHYTTTTGATAGLSLTGGGAIATTGAGLCWTNNGELSLLTSNGTALTQRTTINSSGLLNHLGNAQVGGTITCGGPILLGTSTTGAVAGALYRNANTLRYRDSTNTERLVLNATDNLANLASPATACTNLGLGTANNVSFGSLTVTNGTTLGVRTIATLPLASTAAGQSFRVSDSPVTANRIVTSDGTDWHYEGLAYNVGTSPSSGTAWGGITGTLSSQTDLQSALDAKLNTSAFVPHPGYISGNWYLPEGCSPVSGSALVSGRIALVPFVLREPVTIQTLGARIQTASSGGNIQLAIYAHSNVTGRPTGNALASTGNISTAATGPISAAPSGGNFTLQRGIYWAAVNADNSVVATAAQSASSSAVIALGGASTQTAVLFTTTSSISAVFFTQTFNTWPDLTGQSFTEITNSSTAAHTLIQFRVA